MSRALTVAADTSSDSSGGHRERRREHPVESRPRISPPILDWSDRDQHWDGFNEPCVLCGRPTPLVSDTGKPTHKACAEAWYEQHPDAWLEYEAERDRRASEARRAILASVDDRNLTGCSDPAATKLGGRPGGSMPRLPRAGRPPLNGPWRDPSTFAKSVAGRGESAATRRYRRASRA